MKVELSRPCGRDGKLSLRIVAESAADVCIDQIGTRPSESDIGPGALVVLLSEQVRE